MARIRRNFGSKRGFIAALDSILSIVIALFFMILITRMLTFDPLTAIQMQRTGMDILAVIEEKNILFTPQEAINQAGYQVCVKMEIYNQSYDPSNRIREIRRAGCEVAREPEKVWRMFTDGENYYFVQLSLWPKGEGRERRR